MTTDIERHQAGVVEFSTDDANALRDTIGKGMTDSQFHLFLAQARRLGLDPISKQCYGWLDRGRVVMMTSIDGLRVVRQRTGKFRGIIGPQWCGADGKWTPLDDEGGPTPWLSPDPPAACRVGVVHADHPDRPVWGLATWEQYAQFRRDGNKRVLSGVWANGGPHMLAKCAEALATRMAFPQDLAGVYSEDEIDRDNPERVVIRSSGDPAAGDVVDAEVEHADTHRIERAEGMFNRLPPEGQDKVEQRWAKMLESWDPAAGERPAMIDEGGLADAPVSWFEMIEQTIVRAVEHYDVEPFDVEGEVVEGEVVDDAGHEEPDEADQ